MLFLKAYLQSLGLHLARRKVKVLCDNYVRNLPIGLEWGLGAPAMGGTEGGEGVLILSELAH